jgi:hypothetical protein
VSTASGKAPGRIVIAVVAVVLVVTGAALGRHLLGATAGSSSASDAAAPQSSGHGPGGRSRAPSLGDAGPGIVGTPTTGQAGSAAAANPAAGAGAPSQAPGSGTTLPRIPVYAIAPQIVRTATIDLRVGKDTLNSALSTIAALAASDGGYVESSSMAGGTARTSPLSGTIVIHVLDSDFIDAMGVLSGYGKVTNQQIQGKDVTNQVSTNAATIQILQAEVNLLQGKLSQATDISTFLQIQSQLFPVEQQLQQLQNQQAVLENSAAFAAITASLSAPGAPLVATPVHRPNADAATVAWGYLRHNSLAVLDGVAVGGGWALPVLALLAVIWLVGTRILRRRRQAITPA